MNYSPGQLTVRMFFVELAHEDRQRPLIVAALRAEVCRAFAAKIKGYHNRRELSGFARDFLQITPQHHLTRVIALEHVAGCR